MFSKRKSSSDHLPGLEEPALRPRIHRPPSPRRSSFHGSEPHLHEVDYCQLNQDRKKKYATAPVKHHSASAAASLHREKPATPTKNKNIPQATYQKTFIAIVKGMDSRAKKRRSQEFAECLSPLAQQPVMNLKTAAASSKPPTLPPKPGTGTLCQMMPSSVTHVAPRVIHAGLNHHNEQLYHAEPIPPMKREFFRLSPGPQLYGINKTIQPLTNNHGERLPVVLSLETVV
ncbi:hypothetical protein E2C01_024616 [Portunus trituberculatus]|uniref:Uncharacterized protein n=1 Tax=Portunus trituberculatus TaxID=210409 RepID=A0A5B7EDB3_PORTR|nr:hypothetical protein [Portunus trituberculatus]